MDEFLTNAKHELGIKFNNVEISTIAYADDIVRLSENVGDAHCLINDDDKLFILAQWL